VRNMLLAIVLVGVLPFGSAAEGTFRNEEVTFKSGTVSLAGTLGIPAGCGPFRAVVLLSGSGPQNRDSELLGFRPFKIMAEYFVQQGIAVLRCARWMRFFIGFDPSTALRRVVCPVFAAFGTLDVEVPVRRHTLLETVRRTPHFGTSTTVSKVVCSTR
jgi:hypothetical protein